MSQDQLVIFIGEIIQENLGKSIEERFRERFSTAGCA
jgi:hypothetical protein